MADAMIPVIDLLEYPGNSADLMKASEEWGCFRIVNFDSILPVPLLYDMKAVVASLLDLPLEVKQRNVDAIDGSGYRVSGYSNPIHEGLGLYDIASSTKVDAFCTLLDVTPQQRETIARYAQGVHGLIMDIGRKIGQGLGLADVPFESWPCQLRINKYPFTTETLGSDGLITHSDSGFLTIVQDDEQFSGLEVMRKSGEFIAVDPCPGTLLVFFGDLATVWSNGRFHNMKHRVVSKKIGIRISSATFLFGPKEAMLEAPPELVTRENPRLYIPFTYEDYRKTRMHNKLHVGQALDHYRIDKSQI